MSKFTRPTSKIPNTCNLLWGSMPQYHKKLDMVLATDKNLPKGENSRSKVFVFMKLESSLEAEFELCQGWSIVVRT